jgi:hypothetical protein
VTRKKREKSRVRRQLTITDEPMFIAPELMGHPLASPPRRGAAILVDLVMVLIFIVGQVLIVNHIQNPDLLRLFRESRREEDAIKKKQMRGDVRCRIAHIIRERNPILFPGNINSAIDEGDDARLLALLDEMEFTVVLSLDSRVSSYNEENGLLTIGQDVFGGMGNIAVGAPLFIAYFTLITWLWRGRTPGKTLFGIKVIRLDGKKLSLWNSFGRAGGYAASAATVFIGFLEAIWHPNRQTVHDRIAGTVVIRKTRRADRA